MNRRARKFFDTPLGLTVLLWLVVASYFIWFLLPDPLFVFPPVDFGLDPTIIPNPFRYYSLSDMSFFVLIGVLGTVVFAIADYSIRCNRPKKRKENEKR